jgi:zinc protease
MKKNVFALALLMVLGWQANAQKVEFEEFDLDNGLHVIMHQDNKAPVVTIGVMYDVGGKDPGRKPRNRSAYRFCTFL